MFSILWRSSRALITSLAVTLALTGTAANAQQAPSPVHSVIFTWIGDHAAIHPYRKDALPAVLEQGAKWTHLSFPDSLYGDGFNVTTVPDEMHIMQFNDMSHMQAVFSSPEYVEPSEKYFDKAFSKAIGFPSAGVDPTAGENGNFGNYFAIGLIDLASPGMSAEFIKALKKSAHVFGLRDVSMLTPMLPPGSGAPEMVLISSFTNKAGYDAFMTSEAAISLFKTETKRHALVGGYDTKRPAV